MPFVVAYLEGTEGVSVETFSIGEAVRRARQFRTQGRQNITIEEEGGPRYTLEQAEAQFRDSIGDF